MKAERARSSKSMETRGGADRQQTRCDLAVRKKRWGLGRETMVCHFLFIYHLSWEHLKHIAGGR